MQDVEVADKDGMSLRLNQKTVICSKWRELIKGNSVIDLIFVSNTSSHTLSYK